MINKEMDSIKKNKIAQKLAEEILKIEDIELKNVEQKVPREIIDIIENKFEEVLKDED